MALRGPRILSEQRHRPENKKENWQLMAEKLKRFIESDKKEILRGHQQEAMQDIQMALEKAIKTGYIEMPTGTGKTAIFASLIRALQEGQANERRLKTLILVPLTRILKQTIGRDVINDRDMAQTRGFAKFAPEVKVTPYYAEKQDLTGDVVVMTYQSFGNIMEGKSKKISKEEFAGLFDIVICDEAHGTTSDLKMEQITALNPEAIKLAFTATPEYDENKKVSNIFPEKIHQLTLRKAIEDRRITNAHVFHYDTGVKLDDNQVSINASVGGDYTLETLNKLADNYDNNAKAAEIAIELFSQGKQGIISCLPGDNCAHAEKVGRVVNSTARRLKESGDLSRLPVVRVISAYKTDYEEEKDLDEVFDKYDRGEIDILIFVDMLKEGWDSDKAEFLINMRPTKSKVFAGQRAGRVLRNNPNNPNKNATIIEFIYQMGQSADRASCCFNDLLGNDEFEQGDTMRVGDNTPEKSRLKSIPPGKIERDAFLIPNERVQIIQGDEKKKVRLVAYKDHIYINASILAETLSMKESALRSMTVGQGVRFVGKLITINTFGGFFYEVDALINMIQHHISLAAGKPGRNGEKTFTLMEIGNKILSNEIVGKIIDLGLIKDFSKNLTSREINRMIEQLIDSIVENKSPLTEARG